MDPKSVNITDLAWIECEECGGRLFNEGIIAKRISPIISPSGKEEMYPISVLYCKGCGKVPENISSQIPTFPEELKPVKKIQLG